jgi:hypothetical protein
MTRRGSHDDLLYLTIFKADKEMPVDLAGFTTSLAQAKEVMPKRDDKEKREENEERSEPKNAFTVLLEEASSSLSYLRSLHSVLLLVATASVPLHLKFTLEPTLRKYGKLIFSNAERDVYGLNRFHTTDVSRAIRRTGLSVQGGSEFRSLLLTALISDYDVYLQKLLKIAFNIRPESQTAIQRTLSLEELNEFSSIEDARDYLIDREIDAILHDDHLHHLRSFNNMFHMRVDTADASVKAFLEACERRNLFTHNAGLVNSRYLSKCAQMGIDVSQLVQGEKLDVSSEYLSKALLVSHELKIKLCQYVWRKLVPAEHALADSALNEVAFKLLQDDEYALAERILEYGITNTGKSKSTERIRLIMVVNYANALKLGGMKERAEAELSKVDWSATSEDFKISVAAIRGDARNVIDRLKGAVNGGALSELSIRTWPVFKTMRGEKEFQDKFRELFGSELVSVPSVVAPTDDTSSSATMSAPAGPERKSE